MPSERLHSQTLQAQPSPATADWTRRFAKWTPAVHAKIALYLGVCLALATLLPPSVWSQQAGLALAIGLIGLWRFSWWLTHLVRARIYEARVFPQLRIAADTHWQSGWRPRRIHILLTTFHETRRTAEAVVRAIASEIRATGRPATIWLGSRDPADESIFAEHLKLVADDLDIELRIIRQNQPGKRVAIALILRAMSRAGLGETDIVAFMDSDFILAPGALTRSLSLFAADPTLEAVTTDEDVEIIGPAWVQSWLSMRFAQRRLTMQSHALSGRVLTLTGRFSLLRARHITSLEFIRLIEADHLHHWLWGRFRFLSGDDKSTWYGLLLKGGRMLYVPDATGTTIEVIEGNGIRRMYENLRRWSGNMLRNGSRAIALGPRRMPLFIWWCIVDQRLAMWTMLLGPLVAVVASMRAGIAFLAGYLLYVAVSRLLIALVLFRYARRIDFNYVWCLYVNQLANSTVKLYMIWRLPQQSWANRGNQKAGVASGGLLSGARGGLATYLTAMSVAVLVLIAIYSTGSLSPSQIYDVIAPQ